MFSAAQLAAMLQAPMGQAATIEDHSLNGLAIRCKFKAPQLIETEFSTGVEMSDPRAKVITAEVGDFLARGLWFRTGEKDYSVKRYEHHSSGFTTLYLKDA